MTVPLATAWQNYCTLANCLVRLHAEVRTALTALHVGTECSSQIQTSCPFGDSYYENPRHAFAVADVAGSALPLITASGGRVNTLISLDVPDWATWEIMFSNVRGNLGNVSGPFAHPLDVVVRGLTVGAPQLATRVTVDHPAGSEASPFAIAQTLTYSFAGAVPYSPDFTFPNDGTRAMGLLRWCGPCDKSSQQYNALACPDAALFTGLTYDVHATMATGFQCWTQASGTITSNFTTNTCGGKTAYNLCDPTAAIDTGTPYDTSERSSGYYSRVGAVVWWKIICETCTLVGAPWSVTLNVTAFMTATFGPSSVAGRQFAFNLTALGWNNTAVLGYYATDFAGGVYVRGGSMPRHCDTLCHAFRSRRAFCVHLQFVIKELTAGLAVVNTIPIRIGLSNHLYNIAPYSTQLSIDNIWATQYYDPTAMFNWTLPVAYTDQNTPYQLSVTSISSNPPTLFGKVGVALVSPLTGAPVYNVSAAAGTLSPGVVTLTLSVVDGGIPAIALPLILPSNYGQMSMTSAFYVQMMPYSTCGRGNYATAAYVAGASTVPCSTCTVCNAVGAFYEFSPCTTTSNAICALCTTCTPGLQYAAGACSARGDVFCAPCTTCSGLAYDTGTGCLDGGGVDRACAICSACSAVGTASCVNATTCICKAGWGGLNCSTCTDGRFGALCDQTCSCAMGATSCNMTTGACQCAAGFAGSECDRCTSASAYGATCSGVCGCGQHGHCSNGPGGNGTCSCDDAWGGTTCTVPLGQAIAVYGGVVVLPRVVAVEGQLLSLAIPADFIVVGTVAVVQLALTGGPAWLSIVQNTSSPSGYSWSGTPLRSDVTRGSRFITTNAVNATIIASAASADVAMFTTAVDVLPVNTPPVIMLLPAATLSALSIQPGSVFTLDIVWVSSIAALCVGSPLNATACYTDSDISGGFADSVSLIGTGFPVWLALAPISGGVQGAGFSRQLAGPPTYQISGLAPSSAAQTSGILTVVATDSVGANVSVIVPYAVGARLAAEWTAGATTPVVVTLSRRALRDWVWVLPATSVTVADDTAAVIKYSVAAVQASDGECGWLDVALSLDVVPRPLLRIMIGVLVPTGGGNCSVAVNATTAAGFVVQGLVTVVLAPYLVSASTLGAVVRSPLYRGLQGISPSGGVLPSIIVKALNEDVRFPMLDITANIAAAPTATLHLVVTSVRTSSQRDDAFAEALLQWSCRSVTANTSGSWNCSLSSPAALIAVDTTGGYIETTSSPLIRPGAYALQALVWVANASMTNTLTSTLLSRSPVARLPIAILVMPPATFSLTIGQWRSVTRGCGVLRCALQYARYTRSEGSYYHPSHDPIFLPTAVTACAHRVAARVRQYLQGIARWRVRTRQGVACSRRTAIPSVTAHGRVTRRAVRRARLRRGLAGLVKHWAVQSPTSLGHGLCAQWPALEALLKWMLQTQRAMSHARLRT